MPPLERSWNQVEEYIFYFSIKRLFLKAKPDCVFKYFSKSNAFLFEENAA